MRKFEVTYHDTVFFTVTVEAEDADSAQAMVAEGKYSADQEEEVGRTGEAEPTNVAEVGGAELDETEAANLIHEYVSDRLDLIRERPNDERDHEEEVMLDRLLSGSITFKKEEAS